MRLPRHSHTLGSLGHGRHGLHDLAVILECGPRFAAFDVFVAAVILVILARFKLAQTCFKGQASLDACLVVLCLFLCERLGGMGLAGFLAIKSNPGIAGLEDFTVSPADVLLAGARIGFVVGATGQLPGKNQENDDGKSGGRVVKIMATSVLL